LPGARIVGVVAEVRRFALREPPAMQYYVPFGQEVGIGGTAILARPTGSVENLAAAVRRIVRRADTTALYVFANPMQASVDPLISPWRLGATLFGAFGALALLIAALGLYSVVAYLVTQRTQEFGVRLALGASRSGILSLVLADGLAVAFAGAAAGVLIAILASRSIEPLLFDTSAHDPAIIASTVVLILAVTVVACLFPARRASRLDPTVALRSE